MVKLPDSRYTRSFFVTTPAKTPRQVGDIVQVRGMILGNTSKEREYEDWVNGIVVEAEEYPNFDVSLQILITIAVTE